MVTREPNYVKLEPEKTKRLKLDKWAWEERLIKDKKTGMTKTVTVRVFHVTEEDGRPVDKPWSVLSENLDKTLAPHIETGALFRRTVLITWYPRGYATEYGVALE